jgi:hypothetical protein
VTLLGTEIMARSDMEARPQNDLVRAGNPRIHELDPAYNAPNREAKPYRQPGAKDRRWKRNKASRPKSRLARCATWLDPLWTVAATDGVTCFCQSEAK